MMMWHFDSHDVKLGLHNTMSKKFNQMLISATCDYPKSLKWF